jgi:aspartyl-tRNA(Asn)/glutamyl-tRNA(Gln) amidotransferase subunit A
MTFAQTSTPSWHGKNGNQRAATVRATCAAGGQDAIYTALFDHSAAGQGALSGCLVSVKALFDVAGQVTHAGSARRLHRPPALEDAAVVADLKAAGATLIGHTNMTELAYSGLGLNPHFGTPETPYVPGATAGGSSSGGAASVARGLADIALVSDTGGSARIPAAFCNLVGWKPTASRLSRSGSVPLSFSLDSVGLIGASTLDVSVAFHSLSPAPESPLRKPRLLVPDGFGLDQLDPEVAAAFEFALRRIEKAGWSVAHLAQSYTRPYHAIPAWQFAAVESRACHPDAWAEADRLDPNVARRMKRADEITAPDYAATVLARERFRTQIAAVLGDDLIVLPTVAILPPQIAECESGPAFDRYNALALRNTSFANVIDGCAISLPMTGHDGIGLMLTGAHGRDEPLLQAARMIETILQQTATGPSAL